MYGEDSGIYVQERKDGRWASQLGTVDHRPDPEKAEREEIFQSRIDAVFYTSDHADKTDRGFLFLGRDGDEGASVPLF